MRAVAIGSLLLGVGAFWVMVQELMLSAGSLSSNSPPVGAVGLFLAVLSMTLLLQFVKVPWFVFPGEDTSVDAGVEGLDPAFQDLREAGHLAHRDNRDASFHQGLRRAAGRHDLDVQVCQGTT